MKIFSLKVAVLPSLLSDEMCVCHTGFLAVGSEGAAFSVILAYPSQGVPAVESKKCLRLLIIVWEEVQSPETRP